MDKSLPRSSSRSRKAFEDGIILWNCRLQEREFSLPKILNTSVFSTSMSGGGGAPRRTPSGRPITEIRGHPDIRYHQKNTLALQNSIRYNFDRESMDKYRSELDKQIQDSKNLRRKSEDNGVELVPSMRRHSRSLPRLNTNLHSTDVTSSFVVSPRRDGVPIHGETPLSYRESLRNQSLQKVSCQMKQRKEEDDSSRKHFETWDGYWGRPGGGAPTQLLKKEKLLKLIHKYY